MMLKFPKVLFVGLIIFLNGCATSVLVMNATDVSPISEYNHETKKSFISHDGKLIIHDSICSTGVCPYERTIIIEIEKLKGDFFKDDNNDRGDVRILPRSVVKNGWRKDKIGLIEIPIKKIGIWTPGIYKNNGYDLARSNLRPIQGETNTLYVNYDYINVDNSKKSGEFKEWILVKNNDLNTEKKYVAFTLEPDMTRRPLELLLLFPFTVTIDVITSPFQLWFILANPRFIDG